MGCGTIPWGAETLQLGAEPYDEMRNPITGRGTLLRGGTLPMGAEPYDEMRNPITGAEPYHGVQYPVLGL